MLIKLLKAGLLALKSYIASHVLTCLVPAFLLAGAMVAFINQETILQYLGEQVNRAKSFGLASVASFLLAACSCTVIPVASGLYYSGAGLGVAFIILWVAPAANILALIYTGSILGGAMVVSRLVAALLMAYIVGLIMSLSFREKHPIDEIHRASASVIPPSDPPSKILGKRELWLFLFLLLSLLLPNYLVQKGSYYWKVTIWAVLTAITFIYAFRRFTREEVHAWFRETYFFVKIIFPLLLVGVFLVGIIGQIIPQEWIERWLGGNSLGASFLATLLGAFSYFATMTEAPFVDTLMHMGMGKGPALALLLTGPGISLPNWLAIAKVFGVRKALVYIPTLILLGTIVGFLFGNWIL